MPRAELAAADAIMTIMAFSFLLNGPYEAHGLVKLLSKRNCMTHGVKVTEESSGGDECFHGKTEDIRDDGQEHGGYEDCLGLEIVDLSCEIECSVSRGPRAHDVSGKTNREHHRKSTSPSR